jgi:hypothetical protein
VKIINTESGPVELPETAEEIAAYNRTVADHTRILQDLWEELDRKPTHEELRQRLADEQYHYDQAALEAQNDW